MYTILIVDDEVQIRNILKEFLLMNGNKVVEAKDGKEAVKLMNESISLVIIDVNMPNLTGDKACRMLRRKWNCPVIFLTAYGDNETRIRCYEYGADDFVVKPFRYSDIIVHVNALLIRCYEYDVTNNKQNEKIITQDINSINNISNDTKKDMLIDGLIIDKCRRKITYNDKNIEVTCTEYDIFEFLLKNKGKVFAIDEIYEAVWQEKYCKASANTVMVHIRNLRKKLNNTGREFIFNSWGKGYYVD